MITVEKILNKLTVINHGQFRFTSKVDNNVLALACYQFVKENSKFQNKKKYKTFFEQSDTSQRIYELSWHFLDCLKIERI